MAPKKEKVNVYIDGFNLYFGMTSKFKKHPVKWLNVWALAESIIKPYQELNEVKYFTSMVANDPPKEQRQRAYISALKTTPVQIIYGHYKSKKKSCKSCGHSWNDNEEKMTDVNIAVQMIMDALHNVYDTALLISGDSDLVPPIKQIHNNFPKKKVVVVFPPDRHNNSVKNVAKGSMILGRTKLTKNQFPDQIPTAGTFVIQKPSHWK